MKKQIMIISCISIIIITITIFSITIIKNKNDNEEKLADIQANNNQSQENIEIQQNLQKFYEEIKKEAQDKGLWDVLLEKLNEARNNNQ